MKLVVHCVVRKLCETCSLLQSLNNSQWWNAVCCQNAQRNSYVLWRIAYITDTDHQLTPRTPGRSARQDRTRTNRGVMLDSWNGGRTDRCRAKRVRPSRSCRCETTVGGSDRWSWVVFRRMSWRDRGVGPCHRSQITADHTTIDRLYSNNTTTWCRELSVRLHWKQNTLD